MASYAANYTQFRVNGTETAREMWRFLPSFTHVFGGVEAELVGVRNPNVSENPLSVQILLLILPQTICRILDRGTVGLRRHPQLHSEDEGGPVTGKRNSEVASSQPSPRPAGLHPPAFLRQRMQSPHALWILLLSTSELCRSRPTISLSVFKKLVCATVPDNSSGRTSMIAMQRKPSVMMPHSTNVLDYPCTMSGFERESLAAEAKLKAERKKKKAAKDLATGSGSVEYPQG